MTANALEKLLNHPQVESIEPVQEMHAHLAQGIPLMNALATRSTYDGSGIAIAICDTGIDYNHPRLGGGGFPNSKVIGGYDFGDSDADPIPNTQAHGTCCAGIAAGDLGTVGDYIGGVAPAARLYACKISYGTTGSAYNDAMVAAWDWCVTHRNDDPAHPDHGHQHQLRRRPVFQRLRQQCPGDDDRGQQRRRRGHHGAGLLRQ